jgi:hypothetical protein
MEQDFMNKRTIFSLATITLAIAACSAEPGSARWCEAKKQQPKTEWSLDDASTYAAHCLIDSSTVGSDAWCKRLQDKPKAEWSTDEAASYAKHCVM